VLAWQVTRQGAPWGRARELALLKRHLVDEGPLVLLLAGEPGIGKTRLLHAASRAIVRGGIPPHMRGANPAHAAGRGADERRRWRQPRQPLAKALD
jgi:hypothetical protein